MYATLTKSSDLIFINICGTFDEAMIDNDTSSINFVRILTLCEWCNKINEW